MSKLVTREQGKDNGSRIYSVEELWSVLQKYTSAGTTSYWTLWHAPTCCIRRLSRVCTNTKGRIASSVSVVVSVVMFAASVTLSVMTMEMQLEWKSQLHWMETTRPSARTKIQATATKRLDENGDGALLQSLDD